MTLDMPGLLLGHDKV